MSEVAKGKLHSSPRLDVSQLSKPWVSDFGTTVIFLSFRTDRSGQTVQTQIRLRSSLVRVYTVCHSVCIVWTHYTMIEPHSSNFRVITTKFLGVRIFEKGSVATLADRWWAHRHWAHCLIAREHGAVAEIVKSYSYCFTVFANIWGLFRVLTSTWH